MQNVLLKQAWCVEEQGRLRYWRTAVSSSFVYTSNLIVSHSIYSWMMEIRSNHMIMQQAALCCSICMHMSKVSFCYLQVLATGWYSGWIRWDAPFLLLAWLKTVLRFWPERPPSGSSLSKWTSQMMSILKGYFHHDYKLLLQFTRVRTIINDLIC